MQAYFFMSVTWAFGVSFVRIFFHHVGNLGSSLFLCFSIFPHPVTQPCSNEPCSVCVGVGSHEVVFILDLVPATTGSSAVFPFSPLSLLQAFPPFSHPSLFFLLLFFNSAFSHYSPTCFRRREHTKGELSFPQAFFHAFAHSERLHPRLQFVLPVHLSFQPMRKDPEVVTVTLKKHNGMGLSIVAAKVGNVTWKFVKELKSNFGSSEMFSVCWGLFIF